MPDQGSIGTEPQHPAVVAVTPAEESGRAEAEAEAQGIAHATGLHQDREMQARLQSLYLRFNQLAWEGRRTLALKICAEILEAHGYRIAPAAEGSDDIIVTGWGDPRRIAFPALKAFLKDLVRPCAPEGANGICRNCGAHVMRDDPECWHCSASFARSGFAPVPLRRHLARKSGWLGRLVERLSRDG